MNIDIKLSYGGFNAGGTECVSGWEGHRQREGIVEWLLDRSIGREPITCPIYALDEHGDGSSLFFDLLIDWG